MEDYMEQIEASRNMLENIDIIKELIKEAKENVRYNEERMADDPTSYYSDNAKKYRIQTYCLENMLDKMCFEFYENGRIPPKFDGSEYEPRKEKAA